MSFIFLGGDRRGVPPVPIPNTVVKPSTADGTCLKRDWESMKPPGLIYPPPLVFKKPNGGGFFLRVKPCYRSVDN